MEEKFITVLNEMSEYLSLEQVRKLQEVMLKAFAADEVEKREVSNGEYLKCFWKPKE